MRPRSSSAISFATLPAALFAWLLVSKPARAADALDADGLFRRGKQELAMGEVAAACSDFEASQRLEPAAGTLLNLAECEERRGSFVRALGHLRAALGLLSASDFRVPFAKARVAALSRRVATVEPRFLDARRARDGSLVHVALDGEELPGDARALTLDPGAHRFTVRAEGHNDAAVEVDLLEGESRVVELSLGPARETSVAAPSGARRPLAYVIGGAGAVAMGVGVTTGIMTTVAASAYKSHCNAIGQCDAQGLDAASTGRTMEVVSPVTLLLGAGLVSLGGFLYLTAPKTEPAVSLAPSVSPRAASLSVRAVF